MAEAGSIKSRIAALNIEQVHAPAPTSRPAYSYEQAASVKKAPPPPPPGQRPPIPSRVQTVNNPPVLSNAHTTTRKVGNQPAPAPPELPKRSPALPPRPPPRNNSKPPSLPPRTPSFPAERTPARKASMESISTVSSAISSLSLGSAVTGTSNGGQRYEVRAPAFDPTKLPPLPAKKVPEEQQQQGKTIMKAMRSKSNMAVSARALPPQLPSRPVLPARPESKTNESEQPRRALPPPPRPSALSFALNKSTETPPPVPTSRPPSTSATAASAPPPIPLASRPNLDAIMASKPQPGASGSCLICRDFSGPDNHAAQFPRTSLPSSDVGWLSAQLTAPFPSLTDKARAIFVWLHHNIDYDVHSFFQGTVSPSTPERTITSGLAVCEGYAGLFAALALKAGLECIVVSGHGKGFGHSELKPGDPIPAFSCGHAWNAVRIDHGEWKLVDPCWGAGNVSGTSYNKHFTAAEFTKSNNDFGTKHFPEDNAYQFRTDGRTMTWEEYVMDDIGGRVQLFSDPMGDHGIGLRTFQPSAKCIKVYDPHQPVIRIQFAAACQHWDNEKNGKGKPYLLTLSVGGRDGRNTAQLPFNTDGKVWWIDVNRLDLGAPGQKIQVCCVSTFDGRDARGLTLEQWKARQGRVAQSWSGVCAWELV